MGCHTWFKVKSKYTLEDLRELWVEGSEKWIKHWTEITNDVNHKYRTDTHDGIFKEYTQEQFEHLLKVYKRQLSAVRGGYVKQDFIHHMTWNNTGDETGFEYENGIIYSENESTPHDIFRIGGYPSNKLFSLRESIEFVDTHQVYYNRAGSQAQNRLECLELLIKFWSENPVGMITFG